MKYAITGFEDYKDYIPDAIKQEKIFETFSFDGEHITSTSLKTPTVDKQATRAILEIARSMYLVNGPDERTVNVENNLKKLFDKHPEIEIATGYRTSIGAYDINYSSILSCLIVEAGKSCNKHAADLFIGLR